MPNWCDGTLTITALIKDKDKRELLLKAFKGFAKEGDRVLSTNRFIPYPEKYKKLDRLCEKWEDKKEALDKKGVKDSFKEAEKLYGKYPKDGFNLGGYEWCNKNWGTKWGFCDTSLTDDDLDEDATFVGYNFQTAWSPISPVIKVMSKAFPDLNFEYRYNEESQAFPPTTETWRKGEYEKSEEDED